MAHTKVTAKSHRYKIEHKRLGSINVHTCSNNLTTIVILAVYVIYHGVYIITCTQLCSYMHVSHVTTIIIANVYIN